MAKGDEAAIAGTVDACRGWGALESLAVNAGTLTPIPSSSICITACQKPGSPMVSRAMC